MIFPLKAAEFFARFPAVSGYRNSFGRWADESDRVHCYYTNADGEVGEVIYNPSNTVSVYGIVTGEPAATLKRMYGK